MADTVAAETRSRMMSGIRGKNTRPEMLVRRFLHANGLRYRLHDRRLPGSPDLVFPKHRVALFVHGCFWHQHRGCRYATVPASNKPFWADKFKSNAQRDQAAVDSLLAAGWRVAILWECGLRGPVGTQALDWLPSWVSQGQGGLIEWPEAAATD